MRISDWSSDVCSSDLDRIGGVGVYGRAPFGRQHDQVAGFVQQRVHRRVAACMHGGADQAGFALAPVAAGDWRAVRNAFEVQVVAGEEGGGVGEGDVAQAQYFALPCSLSFKGSALALLCSLPFKGRSEEHTSELQSLMRISYAVLCLKK